MSSDPRPEILLWQSISGIHAHILSEFMIPAIQESFLVQWDDFDDKEDMTYSAVASADMYAM